VNIWLNFSESDEKQVCTKLFKHWQHNFKIHEVLICKWRTENIETVAAIFEKNYKVAKSQDLFASLDLLVGLCNGSIDL